MDFDNLCTVIEPQKKLPVFKPGKWSITHQHRVALNGHDAKIHHEEVPRQFKSRKKTSSVKKSKFTIKAKSIPVTPKKVAASTGAAR